MSSVCPLMESNSLVYCSSVDSPDGSSLNRPRQASSRMPVVTTHTLRGRRLMDLPTLAQNPELVGSGVPKPGRLGQNIQRPKITSRAGSSVTITR